MSNRPWRDREKLVQLYHAKGMMQSEIADKFGCSEQTVYRWMDRLDIEANHERHRDSNVNDEDMLRQMYIEDSMSIRQICRREGVSEGFVRNRLKKFDIEPRTKSEAALSRSSQNGIIHAHLNDYPVIDYHRSPSRQPLYIHRLVAVAKFGFDEVVDRDVHHKDGVKWNNDLENLELCTRSDHMSKHRLEDMDWVGRDGFHTVDK